MAVKIRLMRVGKKKQPSYRVVVADARSPRDGRIIETIGHYRPRQEPSFVDIDDAKALEWLRKGAQPSEQVQKLLAVTGVWATFEAEKGRPAVTSLSRRAYVTGRGPATTKKSKKAVEAEETKPAAAAEGPPSGAESTSSEETKPAAAAEGPPSGAESTSSEEAAPAAAKEAPAAAEEAEAPAAAEEAPAPETPPVDNQEAEPAAEAEGSPSGAESTESAESTSSTETKPAAAAEGPSSGAESTSSDEESAE